MYDRIQLYQHGSLIGDYHDVVQYRWEYENITNPISLTLMTKDKRKVAVKLSSNTTVILWESEEVI